MNLSLVYISTISLQVVGDGVVTWYESLINLYIYVFFTGCRRWCCDVV
jgi:hypothetical protein